MTKNVHACWFVYALRDERVTCRAQQALPGALSSMSTPAKLPPRTPRNSLQAPSSPASLSARPPFDWDAARGLKEPPYKFQTPVQRFRARDNGVAAARGSPRRSEASTQRVYRRKTMSEW